MELSSFLCLISISIVHLCTSSSHYESPPESPSVNFTSLNMSGNVLKDQVGAAPLPFDYFVLACTYLPNYCLVYGSCPPSWWTDPRYQGFGLHGLFPTNDTSSQQYCAGEDFDVNKINSITDRLDMYMLTASYPSNTDFWKHEWEVHGTCSGMSQLDYFTEAVDQFELIKPRLDALPAKNLKFRNDIRREMAAQVGAFGDVQCNYGASHAPGETAVVQVRLKLDLGRKLRDYLPQYNYRTSKPYQGFSGDCLDYPSASF